MGQPDHRRTIAPKWIPQPLRSFVRRQAKDGGLHHVGGLVWLEGASPVVGAYTVPSGRGDALLADPGAQALYETGGSLLLICEGKAGRGAPSQLETIAEAATAIWLTASPAAGSA
jgi:hypothetical protein